jgi:hypothetical protein
MTKCNAQAPRVPCKHGEVVFCVKCYEEPQSIAVDRCLVSGNPCGSDTWMEGTMCHCQNCQRWICLSHRRMQIALRRLSDRAWHDVIKLNYASEYDTIHQLAIAASAAIAEMSTIAKRALEGNDD